MRPMYSRSKPPSDALPRLAILAAHSRRPNPLKRIAYASDASIDIVKRDSSLTRRDSQLLSSDSLRLTLRAFDQTFHLHQLN